MWKLKTDEADGIPSSNIMLKAQSKADKISRAGGSTKTFTPSQLSTPEVREHTTTIRNNKGGSTRTISNIKTTATMSISMAMKRSLTHRVPT